MSEIIHHHMWHWTKWKEQNTVFAKRVRQWFTSLSSRVYGVKQHVLHKKKCRYKLLPFPDIEEHILHSLVKILQLFIQPLELTVSAWNLSEYLCFLQDLLINSGIHKCALLPPAWPLEVLLKGHRIRWSLSPLLVEVRTLLTHLVLIGNHRRRYVLLDEDNGPSVFSPGSRRF